MAVGNFQVYQDVPLRLADGTFDLNTNSFKAILVSAASNALTLTNSVLADINNELATGNGYTAGGIDLTSVTFTASGGVAAFDADNLVWTPAGGDIEAKAVVIHADGTLNSLVNPLLLVADLNTDSSGATVTRSPGDVLQVIINAAGMLRVGPGTLA